NAHNRTRRLRSRAGSKGTMLTGGCPLRRQGCAHTYGFSVILSILKRDFNAEQTSKRTGAKFRCQSLCGAKTRQKFRCRPSSPNRTQAFDIKYILVLRGCLSAAERRFLPDLRDMRRGSAHAPAPPLERLSSPSCAAMLWVKPERGERCRAKL